MLAVLLVNLNLSGTSKFRLLFFTTSSINHRFNVVLYIVVCLVRIKSTCFQFSKDTFYFLFLREGKIKEKDLDAQAIELALIMD